MDHQANSTKYLQIILICIMMLGNLCASGVQISFAQSDSTAYKQYYSGDYVGAEDGFRRILRNKMSARKNAQYFKMLGICQYMQGKTRAASKSFRTAKGYSPRMKISDAEVLDEKIIGYYNSIRVKKPATRQARPRKATRKIQQNRVSKPKPVDRTFLLIKANLKNAIVFIDGKNEGPVGRAVKLEEGLRQVKIFAMGYNPIIKTIRVKKNVTNVVNERFERSMKIKKSSPKKSKNLTRSKAKKKVRTAQTKPRSISEMDQADSISEMDQLNAGAQEERKDEEAEIKLARREKKRSERDEKQSEGDANIIWYFLPFGAGQFENNSNVLGVSFLITQIGSIYVWQDKREQGDILVQETNAELQRRELARINMSEPDRLASIADSQDYRDIQNAAVIKLEAQSQIALGVFGFLWAASTLEAFLSPSSKTKKSRRSQIEFKKEPRTLFTASPQPRLEYQALWIKPSTRPNSPLSPAIWLRYQF